MEQEPMTNDEVMNDIRAIYDTWWKQYRDKEVTYHLLDDAYERGKELLEKHQSKLALDMFVNLFRVLEHRRRTE